MPVLRRRETEFSRKNPVSTYIPLQTSNTTCRIAGFQKNRESLSGLAIAFLIQFLTALIRCGWKGISIALTIRSLDRTYRVLKSWWALFLTAPCRYGWNGISIARVWLSIGKRLVRRGSLSQSLFIPLISLNPLEKNWTATPFLILHSSGVRGTGSNRVLLTFHSAGVGRMGQTHSIDIARDLLSPCTPEERDVNRKAILLMSALQRARCQ